jgi:ketosteroid isomerase-like protein
MRFLIRTTVLCCAVLIGCALFISRSSADSVAHEEIRTALENWSADFNAGNKEAACSLFAPDLVASYPGASDWGHGAMCRQLAAAIDNPDKSLRYDPPQIEEILVSGDLAVVRLIWTLRVTGRDLPGELVVEENGLDVFRRQPDGKWRIRISHAYTQPSPDEEERPNRHRDR